MIRRIAIGLALATGVSITVGAAAVLPIGSTAPLQVVETDAPPFPSNTTTTTTPDPEGPATRGHKVWVCVVLSVGNGWKLKPGANPIEVAATSQVAQDGDDPDHPSYIVSNGDELCVFQG